jgi:hypothetical protein
MPVKTILVNDKMQKNYRYRLSEAAGRNFHPEFRPELSPAKRLKLGVFGGKYMTDCRKEFPKSWFKGAKLCPLRDRHRPFRGLQITGKDAE